MASNPGSEEARTKRLRQKFRRANRLKRQRETAAERDASFLRKLVLTVLY